MMSTLPGLNVETNPGAPAESQVRVGGPQATKAYWHLFRFVGHLATRRLVCPDFSCFRRVLTVPRGVSV